MLLGAFLVAATWAQEPVDGQSEHRSSELPLLRVGETREGRIVDDDSVIRTEVLDAGYTDAPAVGTSYGIVVAESGTYHVDLRSYFFDAYLVLREDDGTVVAEDDDGLINLHARVVVDLVSDETYQIDVCALHGGRGAFELTLRPGRPLELTGSQRLVAAREDARRGAALLDAIQGDDPWLIRARANLAQVFWQLSDLRAARALQESVLAAQEASLPDDHPDLALTRANLASALGSLGELEASRALRESVLATYERTLPEDDPDLVSARSELAETLQTLGDLEAARVLQESVLVARAKTLHEEHPLLLLAQGNLAVTLYRLGDLETARSLQEPILDVYERTQPENELRLAWARNNLALTLFDLGDLEASRALHESALAAAERTLPHDHPHAVQARGNLARALSVLGDLEAARELQESVLTTLEASLPADHPQLFLARHNLAITLLALGAHDSARGLLPDLVSSILLRLELLGGTSPREAREVAGRAAAHLSWIALFLSEAAPRSGRAWAFDLVETVRHISHASPGRSLGAGADDELRAWRREAARLRAKLHDVVVGGSADDESVAKEVGRIAFERDRVERRVAKRSDSGFGDSIRSTSLSQALTPASAAIGYLRYRRPTQDTDTKRPFLEPSVLAHVVRRGHQPVRIELGPATELEALASRWRTIVGEPVGRGLGIEKQPRGNRHRVGEELRRRVLDPVLAAVGDARTLHVCLDDLLYLVPLEALPLGEERVGDRYRIVNEVSFARLIAPPAELVADPSLVALGGASFDVDPGGVARRRGDTPAPPSAEARGRPAPRFSPLPQTRLEAETLSTLFEETFEQEVTLLTEEKATKSALHEVLPGSRYVHLATHGWFAPEGVRSQADDPPNDGLWQRASMEETVVGLAPMTLCGLALTGASTGRDSLGRVRGILTAEELASIDLSQCELAVLSACETNVGIRRAGQGIQSLQSALHAAGARTSITSLWRVDDAVTRRLMELFYTYLWVEKMPKAEALWAAKKVLRDEGAAERDWAGWLLTGDPN